MSAVLSFVEKRAKNEEARFSLGFCNGHFLNEGCVGVRVYTNLQNETKDAFIPFANLKGFVAEKYSFIDGITSWAKKCISDQNER